MSKTKFEVYKDNKGNYRWRLLAQNGEPVASCGEGFSEKRTAMNAVKKLKDWASTTTVLDLEKLKEEANKAKISKSASKTNNKVAPKKAAPKTASKPKTIAKPAAKSAKAKPAQKKEEAKEVRENIVAKTIL